ncbi:transposase [Saccharopolyspora sp. NPDC050389]|uniref:transposase n=1 Tax=Saccharopolyspora sp. NPDC050389 TaxID=3155516 RepID=UPI0033D05084
MGSAHDGDREGAFGELVRFRQEFYECLTARADALFELGEAVLCTDGPVRSLVGLSLAPEHRRGHGALYDAMNSGRTPRGLHGSTTVPSIFTSLCSGSCRRATIAADRSIPIR